MAMASRAGLMLAMLGLSGCLTPEPDSQKLYHTYGSMSSWGRTATNLQSIPQWISYEFRAGGRDLGDAAVRLVDQTGKELERTGENIVGAPGYLYRDAEMHVGPLVDTAEISFIDPTVRDFRETGETLTGIPGDLANHVQFRSSRLGTDLAGIAEGEVERSGDFFSEVWGFLKFMLW
ncbi:MAG: hypothetical protein RL885_07950 [Planctomycetota bacterium]